MFFQLKDLFPSNLIEFEIFVALHRVYNKRTKNYMLIPVTMLRKKAIITLPAKKQEPIHEEELSQEILTQKSPEYTPASPEPEQKKPRLILKRKLAIIPEEKKKKKKQHL